MSRYIDPNSGAAPQPGGFAAPALLQPGSDEATDVGAELDENLTSARSQYEQAQLQEHEDIREKAPDAEDGGDDGSAAQALADQAEDASTEDKPDGPRDAAVQTQAAQFGDPSEQNGQDESGSESGSDDSSDGDESEGSGEESSEGQFDPAEHNADEVKAYANENPDEVQRLLSQEREGKNRSTLISALENSQKG